MNRRQLVPLVLVLGAIGASVAIQVGRGLGPTGRAAGAPGGCAGAEQMELLENGTVEGVEVGPAITLADTPLDDAALWEQEMVPNLYVVRLHTQVLPKLAFADGVVSTGEPDLDRELQAIAAVPERFDPDLDDVWVFESELPWDEVTSRLSEFDQVVWVEPVIELSAASDDPLSFLQGNLVAFGTGSASGVVVAVVDTGVSGGGPDGIGSLLTGYDFVDDDTDASDGNGHGTHVAGTIGQATDNGVGVAAVATGVSILPVRVLGDSGTGTSLDVAAGIVWAADNGAQVINLSLGASSSSTLIAEATDYAISKNVLVVASSGNDGNANGVSFPAANAGVIAVGSVGLDMEVTDYSNGGASLDVVAPGGDLDDDIDGDGYPDGILQETLYNNGFAYMFYEGTSMAAPHVSALAAVLIANGVITVADLTSAITETADDLGTDGFDNATGHGFANVEAALAWSAPAADEPGASFELANVSYQVFPNNNRRAQILWTTLVTTSSCVQFGNTYDACRTKNPVYSLNHRRVVPLPRCNDREFTVYSEDPDGVRAEAVLTIPAQQTCP